MSLVTEGYGPAGNDPSYLMRAFHTASPIGFVYWTVEVTPDEDATQAPYPSNELTDVVTLYEFLPT